MRPESVYHHLFGPNEEESQIVLLGLIMSMYKLSYAHTGSVQHRLYICTGLTEYTHENQCELSRVLEVGFNGVRVIQFTCTLNK